MGAPVSDGSIADRGFRGAKRQAAWAHHDGAVVIRPPPPGSQAAWPNPRQRWLAGRRQVSATVNDRLLHDCRLEHERPHTRAGWQARLAAKIGRHNVCRWRNRQFGQPDLALAKLIDW